MRKFQVKVAVRILEIYVIEAENPADASEQWCDGMLIDTDDEALETELLSVEEI